MSPDRFASATSPLEWARDYLQEHGWDDPVPKRHIEGSQGQILIFRSAGSASSPRLAVLKVRKPSVSWSLAKEFSALETLHAAVEGHDQLTCPEPLALHPDENAYLMSHVEGVPLDALDMDALRGRQVVAAVLEGLSRYYNAVGDIYGDLQPGNILVSPDRVALIDPSLAAPIHREIGASLRFAPASADLGYWVYSVVSRTPGAAFSEPKVARRRLALTKLLLHDAPAIFEAEPGAFLDDVEHGARVRIDRLAKNNGAKGRGIRIAALPLLRRVMQRARRSST